MQTKKGYSKFNVSNGILGFGRDQIYSGTIFIPVNSNYIAASGTSGSHSYISPEQSLKLDKQSDLNQKLIN